ncbi:MAG TPA: YraN family protein [bacterium]|nr:YraN family protein [bacterium]
MASSRAIGDHVEDQACEYLLRLGYEILARNYCVRGGEIDIVARDGDTTVFVEVKYRSGDRYGTGLESVTPRKLERMRRAIERWMADYQTEDVRVDAIELHADRTISHIR